MRAQECRENPPGSSRTAPTAAARNLARIPSVFQTSLENISAAQYCTSQAAQGKSRRMSSGSDLLCNSAHRQHLWVFWDGAGRLSHLPAPALREISRLGLRGVYFVQCIGGEKDGQRGRNVKIHPWCSLPISRRQPGTSRRAGEPPHGCDICDALSLNIFNKEKQSIQTCFMIHSNCK